MTFQHNSQLKWLNFLICLTFNDILNEIEIQMKCNFATSPAPLEKVTTSPTHSGRTSVQFVVLIANFKNSKGRTTLACVPGNSGHLTNIGQIKTMQAKLLPVIQIPYSVLLMGAMVQLMLAHGFLQSKHELLWRWVSDMDISNSITKFRFQRVNSIRHFER